MKTKNFLLTGALLIMALFSVNGVMAAEPIATQSNAKVSIIIDDILSIQVLTPEVELRYDDLNDFTEGVSKEMGEHLLINATRSFDLKVFTLNPFTKEGGTTIEGSTIEISAKASNGNYGNTIRLNANSANGGAQSLFSSPQQAGCDLKYDVNYLHKFNDANTAINTATGVYKADVTYQITAS
jgi:hypothetical protein